VNSHPIDFRRLVLSPSSNRTRSCGCGRSSKTTTRRSGRRSSSRRRRSSSTGRRA
jgi:hypothetical protein